MLSGKGHYLALNSVWSSVIGNALNMYVSSWSVHRLELQGAYPRYGIHTSVFAV